MTNGIILDVFRTHAQVEYGKILEMKSTYILNNLALFLKKKKTRNAFTQSLV